MNSHAWSYRHRVNICVLITMADKNMVRLRENSDDIISVNSIENIINLHVVMYGFVDLLFL